MLTITAYKAESCNDSDKVGTEYTVQLNPTKYKKSWKTNSVEVKQANGLNLVMVKPADPEEISLDFTIDNTGVVPGGDVDIVTNVHLTISIFESHEDAREGCFSCAIFPNQCDFFLPR